MAPDTALTILREAGRPLTTSEVADLARVATHEAYGALSRLLGTGVIQKGGKGAKAPAGQKSVRWRIKPTQT